MHTVTNYERFVSLMQRGMAQRQVHETNMNEHSSRSHSILQIYLAQTHDPPRPDVKDVESVINIVDLAGSERQGKTASTGERFEESKKINHSLMMLGRALNTFSDGKAEYVPLRESKLTRLLSESFGGNARTWMLACVSPSAYNYHESMSTLQYAQNAKAIVNKAKVWLGNCGPGLDRSCLMLGRGRSKKTREVLFFRLQPGRVAWFHPPQKP